MLFNRYHLVKLLQNVILLCLFSLGLGCTEESLTEEYGLPFEYTRIDEGEVLTEGEIVDFTQRLTASWKEANIIEWLRFITYGYGDDKNGSFEYPYYSFFWTGVSPIKNGDTVTFYHRPDGGADNAMIRQITILTNMMALYQYYPDETLALLIDEMARGVTACFWGIVWDESVPESDRTIMARYIINNNFSVTQNDGKSWEVDYTEWRKETTGWASDTIHIENNPYWGDIYVKNKRSKDDVRDIFRAMGLLFFFKERISDPHIKKSVDTMYDYLVGFARDIVDHGYEIRTVDSEGTIYIPEEDLASFVDYGLEAECTARLSAALIGYGETYDMDCEDGIHESYEAIAAATNKFNYNQFRNFHMAALLQSMIHHQEEMALSLMDGYARRMDEDFARSADFFDDPADQEYYNGELSAHIVKAAAVGVPLKSQEIRLLYQWYDKAIEAWESWEYWDIWDDSVPDGIEMPYNPYSRVPFRDIMNFMQYCASPYKNPDGQPFVDCDVIMNPDQWGE